MNKILVYAACISLVWACHSTKPMAPELTQADADRAAAIKPGFTLDNLKESKMLYEANCAKCHQLFAPTNRNEQGWREIVPPMAEKARITADEKEKILTYLIAMSKK
jgi:cytochrome c5